MPLIELQLSVTPLSTMSLGFDIDADLSTSLGLHASVSVGINFVPDFLTEANMSVEVDFGPDIDSSTFLRINATDPNIELAANIDFGINVGALLINQLEFLGIFKFGIDVKQSGRLQWPSTELSELNLTVNIVDVVNFPANYQEYKVRFKIGGVEVPIKKAVVSAPKSKIGTDISVVFSRSSDRSLISGGAVYSLEIGTVISNVVTWHTLSTGFVSTDSYDVGWTDYSPTDEVSLSTTDSIAHAMMSSPYFPVVFFDPEYLDIKPEDLQPVFDASGNLYPTILIPVSGLNVGTVLNYCASQMGIGLSTNISVSAFRIKRLDINIGQPFISAISGLIGVFSPLFIDIGGAVHILDSTMLWIGGSSTPKTLTTSKYRVTRLGKVWPDINGYVVEYVESHDAWDTNKDDDDTVTNTIVDEDENRITQVYTTTTVRSYYRSSLPSIVVRKETVKVLTETWVNDPALYGDGFVLINSSREDFIYDHIGKIIEHGKRESARVPFWYPSESPLSKAGEGQWQYTFTTVKYEHEEYVYKENPFKHGTEYRESLFQYTRALIYTDRDKQFETTDKTDPLDLDPDKEVPIKYKELYIDAYRGGNLQEPDLDPDANSKPPVFPYTYYENVSFEPSQARFEYTVPVSKDVARTETKETDHITKVVTMNVTEEQIGEFSTSSQVGQTRRAIVFSSGGVRTSRRIETLNIGEIPLEYGIPLAQRKLAKANINTEMQCELIGYDPGISKGTILGVTGREGVSLGGYLTEGWQVTLDKLGTPEQSVMSMFDLTEI